MRQMISLPCSWPLQTLTVSFCVSCLCTVLHLKPRQEYGDTALHPTTMLARKDSYSGCADTEAEDGASDGASELYAQLQQLCWCPVLTGPPSPDMPFNPPSSPLAPPKLARPVRVPYLPLCCIRSVRNSLSMEHSMCTILWLTCETV